MRGQGLFWQLTDCRGGVARGSCVVQVSISYSCKHREPTKKFVTLLKHEGYPVWWDCD